VVIRVLLVDDTSASASPLGDLLLALPGVELAYTPANPLELPESVAGQRPDFVVFSLDALLERFDAELRLRAELEEVRARLAERKDVERAKGILMQQRGLTEHDAFSALRSLAMQRGIRLGEAARQVIDVASLLG